METTTSHERVVDAQAYQQLESILTEQQRETLAKSFRFNS